MNFDKTPLWKKLHNCIILRVVSDVLFNNNVLESRFEALPSTRKCDRGWYQALLNYTSWHQWFLAGIVESATMLSRSTLVHLYDNVKAKTAGTSP
jgi:hypothetical protein